MNKLCFLLIPFLFLSCQTKPQVNNSEQSTQLSTQEERQQRQESERLAREEKLEVYRNIIRDNVAMAKAAGSPVLIFNYFTRSPNTAGGVDCVIEYINISDKQLKYVYFTVTPYNAVNDRVSCTISRKSEVALEQTGFIPITSDFHTFVSTYRGWGNVWYNYDIRSVRITKIEVVFDNDSRVAITNPDVISSAVFHSDIELDNDFRRVKQDGR